MMKDKSMTKEQHYHSYMEISRTSILMLFSKRTPRSFIKTKIVPATYAAHLQCNLVSKASYGTLKSYKKKKKERVSHFWDGS